MAQLPVITFGFLKFAVGYGLAMEPIPPKPHFVTKLLLTTIVFGVVGVAFFAVRPLLVRHAAALAEEELQKVIEEIDRAEPGGWRLADIERQRVNVEEGANGANLVVDAARLLPADWNDDPVFSEIDGLPPPGRLQDDIAKKVSAAMARSGAAVKVARGLANFTRGRFAEVALEKTHFTRDAPQQEQIRNVVALLQCDAILRAEANDAKQAWQSTLAPLHISRFLWDEPNLLAQVVRLSMTGASIQSMEQVLGRLVLPAAELRRTRNVLREEESAAVLFPGLRGERAAQHEFYSRLARGDVAIEDLIRVGPGDAEDMDGQIRREILRADAASRRKIIADSHIYMLRTLTNTLIASSRAEPDRSTHLQELRNRVLNDKAHLEFGGFWGREPKGIPLFAAILIPAFSKVANGEQRNESRRHCAIVALAAEEFRLQEKRWPADIAELVAKRILTELPPDPSGREPLQMRRTKDGLVVYSSGWRKDYTGDYWDDLNLAEYELHIDFSSRIEFRLWNPDRRNRPTIPKRAAEPEVPVGVLP
jgi:hypothetical protein